jgi:hypothetical protein
MAGPHCHRYVEGSRPRAGATLAEQLRAAGITVPIFIYSSAKGVERAREEVQAVGGNGATSSMVELFEMIRNPLELAGERDLELLAELWYACRASLRSRLSRDLVKSAEAEAAIR